MLGDAMKMRQYDFGVTVIKGAWSQTNRHFEGRSNVMGWEQYAPHARAVVVPASHSSMYREPGLAAFARELQALLDDIGRAHPTNTSASA